MPTPFQELLPAFREFQLLYVALRLGILPALAAGPLDCSALAVQLKISDSRLLRLLRGLVWSGVLSFDRTSGFALREEARCFLDTAPTSLAGGILFHGQFFYSAWGRLYEYFRDESIPFEIAHGQKLFDCLATDPVLAKEFNSPMSARTSEYSRAIAELPVIRESKSIADIGGGEGQLILDILKICPQCRGLILDLPSVLTEAERKIREAGLADRCIFVSGDMFSSVPRGPDVYILKWILHDWDDNGALVILRTIRANISSAGSLVIVERIMACADKDAQALVQADLNMLVLNGGAERTLQQYENLLIQSGYRLRETSILEQNYGFSAMIAVPV